MSTIPLFEIPEPAEEPRAASPAADPTTDPRALRLVDGAVPGTPDWALSTRERRMGRRGVAAAREALQAAHPVTPRFPLPDELAG